MNKFTALFLTIVCSVLLIIAIFLAGNKNSEEVYNETKHPTFIPYDSDHQITIETIDSGEFICE